MTSNQKPKELDTTQWVIWRNTKGKKIPYIADGIGYTYASSNDPSTWRSFAQAKTTLDQVGYVFTAEDGIIGIDIDHCLKEGKLTPEALTICRSMMGYTEISPGGDGIHILVAGNLGDLKGLNTSSVEIYDRGRYFTFTGDTIYVPKALPERTDVVRALYERLSPKKTSKAPSKVPKGQRSDTLTKVTGALRRLGLPKAVAEVVLQDVNALWMEDGGVESEEVESLVSRYKTWDGPDIEAVPCVLSRMEDIEDYFGKLRWTWADRIPEGHLTMIAGPQAVGKSFFAAHLAAIMSSGQPWPDGTPNGKERKVLIIETEEMRGAWADRLRQAGAKPENIRFAGGVTELVDISERFESVVAACEAWKPDTIIIDSLSAGHKLQENKAEMRSLLQKYSELAGTLRIPIILVHHVRKRAREETMEVTLDRVRGSTTITQLCRSVVALYTYEASGLTKAHWVKSSFCKPPLALGFSITGSGLKFCEAPEPPKKKSAVSDAAEFVETFMDGETVAAKDALESGMEAGYSKSALQRGSRSLRVGHEKRGKEWFWIPASPEYDFTRLVNNSEQPPGVR